MVRDPRDVLVSSYFHATRHRHRFSGDIDTFVQDAGQGLPHLISYLNKSAEMLTSCPHHIVSYEALTADPLAAVTDLLRFLGHDPDVDKLDRAIAAADIANMREIEVRDGIPGHSYDRSDPQALRARRGMVGGFGDYLGSNILSWIATTCASKLSPAALKVIEKTRSGSEVSHPIADPTLAVQ